MSQEILKKLILLSLCISYSCAQMVPSGKDTQLAEIKLKEPTTVKAEKQFYTEKVYETDLSGLTLVYETFKNVVLWVYVQDDEQFSKNLQAALQLIDAKTNHIDIIIVKSELTKLNETYQGGLHIKHYQENKHMPFDEVKDLTVEQLKDQILSVVCPKLQNILEGDLDQYLSGEQVKLLLVMEASHQFFDKVKTDFEHSLKDGALQEAGVVDVRYLDAAVFKNFKQPSLLLYKPNYSLERYDNNITYFDQITDFINLESLPLVIPLNAQYYARVFGGSVNTQLHLLLNGSEDNHLLLEEYQKASKNNKQNDLRYERVLFTYSNFEDNKDLWTQFDFTSQTQLPSIGTTKTNFRKFQLEKYIYDEDAINEEAIGKFLERFREHNVTQFYRSEDVPEQSHTDRVIKVVGKTFIQEILKGRQNIVILFWDSKNPNASKSHESVLRSIGDELPEDKMEFLKIVTFDLALNEHPSITIDTCPVLYLYLAGDKRRPKDYNLEITVDQIKAWLSVNQYSQYKYWITDLELVTFKPEGGYTVVDMVKYKENKKKEAEQLALKLAKALEADRILQAEQLALKLAQDILDAEQLAIKKAKQEEQLAMKLAEDLLAEQVKAEEVKVEETLEKKDINSDL